MLSKVKRCMCFFDLLIHTYKVAPRLSRTLLAKASKEQLLCITEVVVNTLAENVPIPDSTLVKLDKSKRVLRKIARVAHSTLAANSLSATNEEHSQESSSGGGSLTYAAPSIVNNISNKKKRWRDKTNEERAADKERIERLKSVCVTHYKTVIEFLAHCAPYLRELIEGKAVVGTVEDDISNEVQP